MKIPKVITALLGVVLCVALAGCGEGENPAESPAAEQEETVLEQEETAGGIFLRVWLGR